MGNVKSLPDSGSKAEHSMTRTYRVVTTTSGKNSPTFPDNFSEMILIFP